MALTPCRRRDPSAPLRLAAPVTFGLLAAILLGGCAGSRSGGLNVLVPGSGDRPAQVVQLPQDWAPTTVRTLRASPGCLGVEVSQTGSGSKRTIFAMFKDKAAVVAWYRSPAHQALLGKVSFYRDHEFTPGAGLEEGAGPVLVIASMSPAPAGEGVPAGTVLLSVELFRPLPGGVRFGGASFLPRGD